MADLSPSEATVLKGLVRQALRKNQRQRVSGQERWGEEYDPAQHDAKRDLLESAYRKLGGDPANITGREVLREAGDN